MRSALAKSDGPIFGSYGMQCNEFGVNRKEEEPFVKAGDVILLCLIYESVCTFHESILCCQHDLPGNHPHFGTISAFPLPRVARPTARSCPLVT